MKAANRTLLFWRQCLFLEQLVDILFFSENTFRHSLAHLILFRERYFSSSLVWAIVSASSIRTKKISIF